MASQTPVWATVIPAYNAEETISEVLAGVAKYMPRDRILLVDDGSEDGTVAAARRQGIEIYSRAANGGKGCALRAGFERVLAWQPDWILCLDADGQHDPTMVPRFQEAARRGAVDLIIGNRSGDRSGMPLSRRFSNRVSSALLSLRTGMHLPDVQCGFRAIQADFLQRLRLRAEKYDIEVEMILQTWRQGGRISWVSIPTLYRGERSFMRKFPETMRFLKLMTGSLHHEI